MRSDLGLKGVAYRDGRLSEVSYHLEGGNLAKR